MFADFDLIDVVHTLERGENRNLEFHGGKLGRGEGHEAWVADGSGNRALSYSSTQRTDGVNVSDAAPEFVAAMQRHERTAYFFQCTRGFGYARRFPRQIRSDGIAC